MIGGLVSGLIGGVGDIFSGGAKASNQAKNEKSMYDASGESKSLEAQRAMNAHQDQVSADMTKLQDEANTTKKIADTAMMIQQGREESWGKAMSSAAKTVNGINF